MTDNKSSESDEILGENLPDDISEPESATFEKGADEPSNKRGSEDN